MQPELLFPGLELDGRDNEPAQCSHPQMPQTIARRSLEPNIDAAI